MTASTDLSFLFRREATSYVPQASTEPAEPRSRRYALCEEIRVHLVEDEPGADEPLRLRIVGEEADLLVVTTDHDLARYRVRQRNRPCPPRQVMVRRGTVFLLSRDRVRYVSPGRKRK